MCDLNSNVGYWKIHGQCPRANKKRKPDGHGKAQAWIDQSWESCFPDNEHPHHIHLEQSAGQDKGFSSNHAHPTRWKFLIVVNLKNINFHVWDSKKPTVVMKHIAQHIQPLKLEKINHLLNSAT